MSETADSSDVFGRAPVSDPEGSGLDELDLAIARRLQVDGRASFRSIADSVGVSETTVRNRLRRLLDEDLVQVVTVVRPLTTRTTVIAMLLLKIVGDPQPVADEVASWPEATFVALTGGAGDLLVELVAVDRVAFLDLWRAIHEVDGVVDVQMNTYLKVAKQLYTGPTFT